jgi:hypothetical protein
MELIVFLTDRRDQLSLKSRNRPQKGYVCEISQLKFRTESGI